MRTNRRSRASPEQITCRPPVRSSRRRKRDGQLVPPAVEDTAVRKPAHPCIACADRERGVHARRVVVTRAIVHNRGVDDMVLDAPALTIDEAVAWAGRLYGVGGTGSPLPSERDQNVLLETESGDRFVLKIANALELRALLEAQNAALAHVARRSPLCPAVIPTLDGAAIGEISVRGATHLVRLFTWLPGVPLAQAGDVTTDLLENLGARLAELDAALEGFDHPAVHRDFYWDLARAFSIVADASELLPEESMRSLVTTLAARIEARDGARLARLRRAVV